MSPIDDQLRAALHGRAQAVSPSPDPLAGIERRARRMRRNRTAAAVTGSALAVALVAVAVPAVQSAVAPQRDVPTVAASDGPTADPSAQPVPDASRYALDPLDPWPYRGVPLEQLGTGTVETVEREYAARRGGGPVELTPLFGQVDEPSQRTELVFLAEVPGADGAPRYFWGVARSSESGPEFPWDEELSEPALALAAALPGDEVPRLLVVTTPEAGRILYGSQGSDEASIGSDVPGVALTALERDPATDFYRVLVDGDELVTASAPDPQDGPQQEPTEPRTGAALDPGSPWELRGDASLLEDGDLQAVGADWAQRHGASADELEVTPLYVSSYEPGAAVELVHLVRDGSGPWWWGVSSKGSDGRWRWYADNPLEDGSEALAAALPADEGSERLLVVAAPFVGGAVYAADGSSYEPMTDLAAGVFITPVAPGDPDDRFKVLDGNGDLDDPVVEGGAPDLQNAG